MDIRYFSNALFVAEKPSAPPGFTLPGWSKNVPVSVENWRKGIQLRRPNPESVMGCSARPILGA